MRMARSLNSTSGMDTSQKRLLRPLLLITGVITASLFLMMADFRYGNSFPGLAAPIIFLASPALFVLSLVVLLGVVWIGVRVHGLEKMDALWWLSAPYSIAFPLSMLLFQIQGFGHSLAPLFLLCMITTLSSAVWMLATIYQLVASRMKNVGLKKMAMLAIVVLEGILWAALRANPSQ